MGPMGFLTDREHRILRAVCDTLVPADETDSSSALMALSADSLDLADRFEQAIESITTPAEQRQLRIFLQALSSLLVNGLLAGIWLPFDQMSLSERTDILRGWMQSRFNLRRQAFQAVKRMALFLFYASVPQGEKANPTWVSFDYEPPASPPEVEAEIRPLQIGQPSKLETDVVVVGSGAAGGLIAAELTAAGLDVVVMEKGGCRTASDFEGHELEGNAQLFEKGGALTTADLGVVVLAGSTLGGGTVVNWSTSLPTPQGVRHEWAREYGFEGVDGAGYETSLQSVLARIHAQSAESDPNAQNAAFARGLEALGHPVQVIERNVKGCVDCTYCMFGCRYQAKQSALVTTLLDAYRRGARVLVDCRAERVRIERGRAVGVDARLERDGRIYTVEVSARAVVVCAGAIHTPALLLRSGLRNKNIGRHLRLHPVTAPFGLYEDPIRSWDGPPQTRLSEALADLDGQGYGVRLEVAPAHPGLWASALPWTSGHDHKRLMAQLNRMANVIAITRDRGSGWISLDRFGDPVLNYQLDPYDAVHLARGLEEAIRVHRAAGAIRIMSPHSRPVVYERGKGDFDDYLSAVRSQSLAPNRIGLFSAHQMGSCRIASDPARGAVRPDGQTWEVSGLFVADGSVFPTACGVNPMVPILATAHFLSGAIAGKLT
jgi:choline dehydrogenase-like flavoprotein